MTELAIVNVPALVPEQENKTASNPQRKPSTPLERLTRIHHHLRQITASWEPNGSTLEPRKLHRMTFTERLILTPMCESSLQPTGDSLLIQGHDLSLGGLSFSHRNPLIFSEVAITFLQPDNSSVTIATKLNWCRFSRQGIYFSGGQFLRLLDLERTTFEEIDQLSLA